MLLAALICGLVTAYYFGLRPGAVAAVVALALFLAGRFVPGLGLISYLAVGGGLTGVYVLGSKRPRDPALGRAFDAGKRLLGRAWKKKDE